MKINRRNIHLLISVIIVIPAAIIYGLIPNLLLDLQPETTDEANFNKSIMMLYLGFSGLWIIGLFNKDYFKIALVTNIVFMLGLSFGRILSILIDGTPSSFYVFGTIGELILGFYGFWVLKMNPLK